MAEVLINSTPILKAILLAIPDWHEDDPGKIYPEDIRAKYAELDDPRRMPEAAFRLYVGKLLDPHRRKEGKVRKTYYLVSRNMFRKIVDASNLHAPANCAELDAIYAYLKASYSIKRAKETLRMDAPGYSIVILLASPDQSYDKRIMKETIEETRKETRFIRFDLNSYINEMGTRHISLSKCIAKYNSMEGGPFASVMQCFCNNPSMFDVTSLEELIVDDRVIKSMPLKYHIHAYKSNRNMDHIVKWVENANTDEDHLTLILKTGDLDLIAAFMEQRYGELFSQNGIILEM